MPGQMAVLWMSSSTVVLVMHRCQPSTLHGQTRLGGSDLTVDGPPSVVSRMSFFLKSGVQASSAAMNCPQASTTFFNRTFPETHPRHHDHRFRAYTIHVSATPDTNQPSQLTKRQRRRDPPPIHGPPRSNHHH